MEPIQQFLEKLRASLAEDTFHKLTLSKPGGASRDLKNVYVRPVILKGTPQLSFTLRYATRDETKNHPHEEALAIIALWLGVDFLNADLFTKEEDLSLQFNKKRKPSLFSRPPTHTNPPDTRHDKEKNYLVEATGNTYLHLLGITTAAGEIHKDGRKKFRQINKYIEIIEGLLRQHPLPENAHIVDMGSGKGYLTFALYDYLTREKGYKVSITGIELRPELVASCNAIARQCGFDGLQFVAQDIHKYQPKRIDMLIALHACDTATDEAIAKGIHARAEIIVTAPCCHKQIRKQMQGNEAMQPILKHGILEERQAELITDGLRALLMEDQGYATNVFEFISLEHTSKNLMITGVKSQPKAGALAQVERIKQTYGIGYHHLERLLNEEAPDA